MFKAITFTDVHLADKGPLTRIDDYREAILNKLEQIRDLAIERKVDVALCAGDLFHIKTPSKNSHYLVSRTIEIFKSFPCPVYSIYGNHDISQDNISTLPKQPFYVCLKAKAFNYLDEVFFDEGNIRIFGMDYLAEPEYSDFNREKTSEKIQICVAHVNASSKFDDLFGERVYKYQELSKTSPDVFLFGHYHPDQGIEIHNKKHFINVGSLSRGSLKKDELSRIPNAGYIEISDDYEVKTEKIPLNCIPASEIFDLERKRQEDEEQKEIENFINEMQDKIDTDDLNDIEKTIKNMKFEKNIVDTALHYFEKAL
jgi:DNA repair exonuclease SbcCD nuclease subunit